MELYCQSRFCSFNKIAIIFVLNGEEFLISVSLVGISFHRSGAVSLIRREHRETGEQRQRETEK